MYMKKVTSSDNAEYWNSSILTTGNIIFYIIINPFFKFHRYIFGAINMDLKSIFN